MVTFDFVKTPITQIADFIIVQSAKSNASDIHFDPRENGLIVRMRVDGELKDYTFIPKIYQRNLITRLKLLASMNITESRLPQDGAIKGNIGGINLDMRVSCLPTNEGEKIVIRILDYTRSFGGLESLGFSESNFEKLNKMIHVPNGIILVTGATGTGKSTTTYAILQELNQEETNIITVEDPIEMNIEGMNQVQINSEIGLDFATVLRSILRQDPNIILIGEIRDSETAQIAVRASITGHLVLSTLHTNNSLSTIERLVDMNVERYLLSSALTGIISQRLAKKLCPHCREEKEATPYEKKIYKIALNKDIDKLYTAHEEGCNECTHGYKGRVAIHEVLEIDDYIREALTDATVKKDNLREVVYTSNVTSMLQDALLKVLEGLTSFDEIYRIIDIDDDIETVFRENAKKYKENNKSLDRTDEQHETTESKEENKLELEDNILNQSIASAANTVEKEETPLDDTTITIPTVNSTQAEQSVDTNTTEQNNIVDQSTVTLPTADTTQVEQPVDTNITQQNNIVDQSTVTLPTTGTTQSEQPVETNITEQNNIVDQSTVTLPTADTTQVEQPVDTNITIQNNSLDDGIVALPIVPTFTEPQIEQTASEQIQQQVQVPTFEGFTPVTNTTPTETTSQTIVSDNMELGEIKIVPPTDEQGVNKENIFDNIIEKTETEVTKETKEEENYYDKLGVKPRIAPTVATEEKIIDATTQATAVDKTIALTPTTNAVNMSVPTDVPIAAPKQLS